MPKFKERIRKKRKNNRHDPLEKQIMDSLEKGKLKEPKEDDEDMDKKGGGGAEETRISPAMSQKILQQAEAQKAEIQQEAAGSGKRGGARGRGGRMAFDGEDSDEEQEELLNAHFEDVEELEMTEEEEKALQMFMPTSQSTTRTLADIIMEKIREKEQEGKASGTPEEAMKKTIDPQIVEVYTELGKYMHSYKSGKVPKAFKIIPALKNWEDILLLTSPSTWSNQAMFIATRLFASNLNPKMAQRFYNLVLLPRVRDDIDNNKRLNYHLYAALKKSIYKPASFFRGILLPLAEHGCSVREAVIFCSILSKCSIPMLHSSVALMKMAQMSYSGPVTLMMKTLLNKKYSLPYRVIDALVSYFCRFQDDERQMPVVWHQNLLTFVQRYKENLSAGQRDRLKSTMRAQSHNIITPEIRRELFSTVGDSQKESNVALKRQSMEDVGGVAAQAKYRSPEAL